MVRLGLIAEIASHAVVGAESVAPLLGHNELPTPQRHGICSDPRRITGPIVEISLR